LSALPPRYPERVYQRTRDLLGKSFSEAQALLKSSYLAYDLVEDAERGTVRIRTHDGSAEYSVEELVAMVLSYAVDLAEHYTKLPMKDVVITVPPFYGQRQRQALLDAAEIAGLKVGRYKGAAAQ
jgi:hypoxia up-regulated 1